MNAIAEGFLLAAAASDQQCRALIDKKWSASVLRNESDRVTIWECDERIVEGWNGTQPQFQDWAENFSIRPNRDGIHGAYAESVEQFLRALIEREEPAKKTVTEVGHSQGGAHAHVSAFYKRRQAHMKSAGPISYGGPPWTMDEHCVPGSVRVTTPQDPVPCDRLRWIPFFRRMKRMPRTEIDGCPGARRLGLLDHDYLCYAHGLARLCHSVGDIEGERKMHELMEIVNQSWRKLEEL